MERPTVLLLLAADHGHAEALRRGGFDVLSDAAEGLRRLALGEAFDLAVLDCDRAPDELVDVYGALHAERAIPTVLLFSDDVPSFGAAGADESRTEEYVMKPVPPEALVYRLQAVLIRIGHTAPAEMAGADGSSALALPSIGEGHVVSIFAPKGGVGKTTIAVNLAVALRQQTRANVLLFDADVGVGNVTSVLEVPYRVGLVDLADTGPEQWTDAAFEQTVATHADTGVRVVTWGNDPADSERVTVDLLLAAMRWARRHHAYVIVDNHPGYADRTMAMLSVANEILLVVTPEVGPLKNSAQFIDLARQLGLGDMIRVIANRANHGVGVEQMAESLGLPIAATVVSNGPKAVIAANEGRPVITKFPRERIATDLHNVARLITRQEEARSQPPPRRWWMPFTSRTTNA